MVVKNVTLKKWVAVESIHPREAFSRFRLRQIDSDCVCSAECVCSVDFRLGVEEEVAGRIVTESLCPTVRVPLIIYQVGPVLSQSCFVEG